MVSLDKRGEYLAGILGNEKFLIFYNFIVSNGTSVIGKNPSSSEVIDDNFMGILEAICDTNAQVFQKHYSQYSLRTPSSNSPFVNDDYLLFSLIIGVKKFGLSQEWVEKVLQVRKCTSDDCKQTLITFKNILLQNYNSLDNHFGIILLFQSILNIELLIPNNKAKLYLDITSSVFPSKRSDFLNIIELRSYDVLINEQLLSSDSEYQKYKEIVQNIELRVIQASNFIFYLICLIAVIGVLWSYYKYDNVKEIVQNFEAIFGFLGLPGVIVMIFNKEKITNYFARQLRTFWGTTPLFKIKNGNYDS